ncbi:MAG: NnrS family protein [Geminicoccaceae bacterium]
MSAQAAGIPRYRPFDGPALLRQGFRPFFLGAGLWALAAMLEPLVWSLHLGFVWVPIGLLLVGLGAFLPDVPPAARLHALTAGAMGGMTLAVMTRATLGHTGRPLTADGWTAVVYLLVAAAAILRVAAPFSAGVYVPLLWTSGLAWSTAFGLFAVRYGRLLLTR